MSELNDKDYPWLVEARKYIGLKEIPGPKNNSIIVEWLRQLHAWWYEDETPWCGTFVAHCCQTANLKLPKFWMRALAWSKAGEVLKFPKYGCIVTFNRQGGGHVGFLVGKDRYNNLMILGGNQGNMVSIKPFSYSRVESFIWPLKVDDSCPAICTSQDLPLLTSDGKLSNNEV